MKGLYSSGRTCVVLPLLALLCCTLCTLATAQGFSDSLNYANPSNDSGWPRRSDSVAVASSMLTPCLPRNPFLELGYLYSFGSKVRTGRITLDYTRPFHLNPDSVLFGEAHAESWDFWKRPGAAITAPEGFTTTVSRARNRVDLSFGGGYRTILCEGTMLGVNGFYDASSLYNTWYSSGGVGLEMAATVGGDDEVDLNINWYGNLFNKNVLVNAFRNHGGSFDVEAGYTHAFFDHALDLRLKFAGYQFDVGKTVYGWRSGADLGTKNGMFMLRYEYGSDRLNGQYNTVGGFVTIGFQLENLLSWESPFTVPEPEFKCGCPFRRVLSQKVNRNWWFPSAVLRATTASVPVPGEDPGVDP